ncbi:MAG TPA: hypothetical protein VGC07_10925 [Granulicella sp.]
MAPSRPLLSAALALLLLPQPMLRAQETAFLSLPDAPEVHLAASDLQSSSSTSQPAPQAETHKQQHATEEQMEEQLHQRMAVVIPNFNAVLDGHPIPLTRRQKMRAAFRSAIDPYQFGLAFVTSSYGQALDSHDTIDANGVRHGYGQGWEGFGKRYGANYTDQFTGAIIGNGILPALLHQDARYYRMGERASFAKRFFYAISTAVICHSDSGRLQPNYSNVLGNLASGGISNLYYPEAERGFGLTVEQGMIVTAEGSIGSLLVEFYPDVRRHFSKKKGIATP